MFCSVIFPYLLLFSVHFDSHGRDGRLSRCTTQPPWTSCSNVDAGGNGRVATRPRVVGAGDDLRLWRGDAGACVHQVNRRSDVALWLRQMSAHEEHPSRKLLWTVSDSAGNLQIRGVWGRWSGHTDSTYCPMQVPRAETAWSISWLDVVKGDLYPASVSLGLVLRMFVVFIVYLFTCGRTCNQLTSKVDGGITGSRLRCSILT